MPSSLWSPLRHTAFRWLLAARIAAFLAHAVAPVALAFAVLDLTGSVVDLGIVVGARSIATVVLLLFGGVLADRLPRGVVLQGSAVAAAVTQGLIALSVLAGFASVPLLIVLSTLNGAVAAASIPASLSILPSTVPASLLRPANAIMRMGGTTAMTVGASISGLVAGVAGPGWAVALGAVAFALAALGYLRVPSSGGSVSRTHPLRELREGWAEFRSRTWVWVVVLQFMVVNAAIVGGTQVLGPTVADATIGRPAWGLVIGAQTIGAFIGALIAARWHPRRPLFVGVTSVLFETLPLLALALTPQLGVLIAAMFLTGLISEQFGIAWDTSMQQNIPQDKLARVYSYDAIGSILAIPIGEMAIGPLSQHLGTTPTLIGAATLIALATLAALTSRSVRTLTAR
ncbi:MFS transporter [Actinocrispum sp. NPDC049592]|uniref:MFS transporter n=1 Tax=Actinocrispum sp. NPDC049592 TaxID=3154835 RepID=UPI0034345248